MSTTFPYNVNRNHDVRHKAAENSGWKRSNSLSSDGTAPSVNVYRSLFIDKLLLEPNWHLLQRLMLKTVSDSFGESTQCEASQQIHAESDELTGEEDEDEELEEVIQSMRARHRYSQSDQLATKLYFRSLHELRKMELGLWKSFTVIIDLKSTERYVQTFSLCFTWSRALIDQLKCNLRGNHSETGEVKHLQAVQNNIALPIKNAHQCKIVAYLYPGFRWLRIWWVEPTHTRCWIWRNRVPKYSEMSARRPNASYARVITQNMKFNGKRRYEYVCNPDGCNVHIQRK